MKNNQSGQIIIIASVFTAILLIMSIGMISYSSLHIKAERISIQQNQALNIAEAGIEKAIYQLNQNPNYSGESNIVFGDGIFTTSITSIDGNNKRITSTASISNSSVQKIVKATAVIDYSTVSFQFGVQSGEGGFFMANGSRVNGNIFSNGNITGSGLITGNASVAVGTTALPEQQWLVNNSDFSFGNVLNKKDIAQSFILLSSNNLNKISINIKKIGIPGDISVNIVQDNEGNPSKNVLASGTINASLITGSYGFIDVSLSTAPYLLSGQKYWVILSCSGISASNYFNLASDNTDAYTSGTGKYSASWNAKNPIWTAVNQDFNFKAYVGGVITYISGVTVSGDARATKLQDCTISGNAYFETTNTCSVSGAEYSGIQAPAPQAMPISDSQIEDWENTAQAEQVIQGNYSISDVSYLGPAKIAGDLTLNNGAVIYLTGPVWVEGDILLNNNSAIRVDSSLGNAGVVIIADYKENTTAKGRIINSNNSTFAGNGNPNSRILVLTTYSGTEYAINLNNNVSGSTAIFYASKGKIIDNNNATVNQLTAYLVELENNAIVNYTSGLQNVNFSNGPGGSWTFKQGSYVIIK